MASVIITCSRCGNKVSGMRGEDFTAGFYDVTGGYWKRFAREGETDLCDPCMWADPEYIQVYRSDAEALKWREENGYE